MAMPGAGRGKLTGSSATSGKFGLTSAMEMQRGSIATGFGNR